MQTKEAKQYRKMGDEHRLSQTNVASRDKAKRAPQGPQIPFVSMAELSGNPVLRRSTRLPGEENSYMNNNNEGPAEQRSVVQVGKDKEESSGSAVDSTREGPQNVELEDIPDHYLMVQSRRVVAAVPPLNLKGITAEKLLQLKKNIMLGVRGLSIESGNEKINFRRAQELYREQLNDALMSLARQEVLGDDSAEAILNEYNRLCERFYKEIISDIRRSENVDFNLISIWKETKKTFGDSKKTKLINASCLKKSVEQESAFYQQKLNVVFSRLDKLAKKGDVSAQVRLNEYNAFMGLGNVPIEHQQTKLAKEVTRLNYYAKINLPRLESGFKLGESCVMLADQISYGKDSSFEKIIHAHIKNKRECQLGTLMRQACALGIVGKLVNQDSTTTAKIVPLLQGVPKYITDMKNIFKHHESELFNEKTVGCLADEIASSLGNAILHYEKKPGDTRLSRSFRMFSGESEKNASIIVCLKELLSWVEQTSPTYVFTDVTLADDEGSGEFNELNQFSIIRRADDESELRGLIANNLDSDEEGPVYRSHSSDDSSVSDGDVSGNDPDCPDQIDRLFPKEDFDRYEDGWEGNPQLRVNLTPSPKGFE